MFVYVDVWNVNVCQAIDTPYDSKLMRRMWILLFTTFFCVSVSKAVSQDLPSSPYSCCSSSFFSFTAFAMVSVDDVLEHPSHYDKIFSFIFHHSNTLSLCKVHRKRFGNHMFWGRFLSIVNRFIFLRFDIIHFHIHPDTNIFRSNFVWL